MLSPPKRVSRLLCPGEFPFSSYLIFFLDPSRLTLKRAGCLCAGALHQPTTVLQTRTSGYWPERRYVVRGKGANFSFQFHGQRVVGASALSTFRLIPPRPNPPPPTEAVCGGGVPGASSPVARRCLSQDCAVLHRGQAPLRLRDCTCSAPCPLCPPPVLLPRRRDVLLCG